MKNDSYIYTFELNLTIKMNLQLKNKTALILSSSKGIGLGVAKALAKEKCKIIITSSNKKNILKAQKEIQKNTNYKPEYILMNLNSSTSVNKIIKFIVKKKIDILVVNSPGPIPVNIENLKINDLNKSININLINLIKIVQKVIPNMKKNKFGRIINLASTTGKEPDEGMVLSNITRAAMLAFSKTVSKELSKYGITSNSILTGGVMTERTKNLIKNDAKALNKSYESILKQATKNIPAGFISTPEQFANFIVFLCSPLSLYINGTSIPVDGGIMKSI